MQAALPHARGFVLMLAGECPLCGAGRLEDGAPAPHEHLRRGWLDTLPRRDWRGLDKNGFALTLAGECPLCGAGAP